MLGSGTTRYPIHRNPPGGGTGPDGGGPLVVDLPLPDRLIEGGAAGVGGAAARDVAAAASAAAATPAAVPDVEVGGAAGEGIAISPAFAAAGAGEILTVRGCAATASP